MDGTESFDLSRIHRIIVLSVLSITASETSSVNPNNV